MEADFWHQCWDKNDIGFHEQKANPMLVKYLDSLALQTGDRIFLPLCGKTPAIQWLLNTDFKIVGVELSPLAVEQLFSDLKIEPTITDCGPFKRYQANNIDIYLGDLFNLSQDQLGPVQAIFDRAALVALPPQMREQYTAHLKIISCVAPQLLLSFDYDQSLRSGPPFSVPESDIQQYYNITYHIKLLERKTITSVDPAIDLRESVWLLTPKKDNIK